MLETKELASYIASSRVEDIPADVVHEAKRALLNFVGCAIGGSREPAVDTAIRALQPFSGEQTAGLLARPERFDPLYAHSRARTALLESISCTRSSWALKQSRA